MIIRDLNEQAQYPDLKPADVNVNQRFMLSLKDNHNAADVEHFTQWVAERVFAYQFGHFYEYKLTLDPSIGKPSHEVLKDYENKIGPSVFKETFHRYGFKIATKIQNKFPSQNNGDQEVNADWYLHFNFINLLGLTKVCVINTDDIPFQTPGAAIFLRSVAGVMVQQYCKFFPEKIQRSFTVLHAASPELEADARELISKVQDLSKTRDEVITMLGSMKCLETGENYSDLLEKDFTIFK